MWGIFHIILSDPHDIVMDLNNVMIGRFISTQIALKSKHNQGHTLEKVCNALAAESQLRFEVICRIVTGIKNLKKCKAHKQTNCE
jgi:hypothetical protein